MATKKNQPGCPCCGGGCVGTVTADSTCNGATISGATYKIIASDGVTVVATLTGGTSVVFSGLTGATDYYVEVSKTGYHTKRSALFTLGCAASLSKTVPTWPTTYNLTVNVKIKTCNHSGATVDVAGDATGSGSTDGSGNVTLSLSSSSSAELQSLSYTVTPASGYGAAVKTGSWSIHACSPTTQNVGLIPSAGHVDVICGGRYLPEDLDWTDDYGATTITYGTYGATIWGGSYTYTSSHAVKKTLCLDNPVEQNYSEQTADITVYCRVNVIAEACGSTTFRFRRDMNTAIALDCVESGATYHCQPRDDDHPDSTHPFTPGTSYQVDQSYTCGSSITMNVAFGPTPDVGETCAGGYEESEVDIEVTGTIT